MPTDEPQLDELLLPALEAARRGAVEILAVYGGEFDVERKADSTPITEADRRAHGVIGRSLQSASPYPILSEEGVDIPYEQRRRWRRYWLIDPLDGTVEFVKRNGEFTVNIALIEAGEPLLGVVYAPVLDLLYFAHRGLGARRLAGFARRFPGPEARSWQSAPAGALQALLEAGQRLPPREPLDLTPGRRYPVIRVIGSRSHRGPQFEAYLKRLEEQHADRIELEVLGSALKPCAVAEGRADLYPRFGRTMEWDMAAAHAVVRAVGKRMTAMDTGAELVYNKPVLANPSILVF
jgi:3'(2'), 5'-bisphosphate nucleotidase